MAFGSAHLVFSAVNLYEDTLQEQTSPQDVRRVMMRGRKVAAWKRLTLPERDVLTCLTAICKVRLFFKWSKEGPPFQDLSAYCQQGDKLYMSHMQFHGIG